MAHYVLKYEQYKGGKPIIMEVGWAFRLFFTKKSILLKKYVPFHVFQGFPKWNNVLPCSVNRWNSTHHQKWFNFEKLKNNFEHTFGVKVKQGCVLKFIKFWLIQYPLG